MKTAQQLRDITLSNKIDIAEMLKNAETMASAGQRFWASELHKVNLTDTMKSTLSELGFTITIKEDSNFFKIEW